MDYAEFKYFTAKYGWSGTSEEDNHGLEEFMAQYNDFVQCLIDEGEQKGIQDDSAKVNEYKRKLDAVLAWCKEHNLPVPAEVLDPPQTN